MQYFISFLEGIITFISPCLLPMLPIYVSYFAGGVSDEKDNKRVIKNALGFILGFTAVFVLLGALAGFLGGLLRQYSVVVNIVTGLIVIFFGLNFLGVFRLNIFKGSHMEKRNPWDSSPPFSLESCSQLDGHLVSVHFSAQP